MSGDPGPGTMLHWEDFPVGLAIETGSMTLSKEDMIAFARQFGARRSRSRPDRGLVRSAWQVLDQLGETVVKMEGWGMFGRRPA